MVDWASAICLRHSPFPIRYFPFAAPRNSPDTNHLNYLQLALHQALNTLTAAASKEARVCENFHKFPCGRRRPGASLQRFRAPWHPIEL